MAGLLDPLDGDTEVDAAVDDAALVRAMLDVEAALARALERFGLVPGAAAEAVVNAAARISVDIDELGRRSVPAGNPVVPLVRALSATIPDDAQVALHHGATSQDVLDTALQLVAHRALAHVVSLMMRSGDIAADLAAAHRDTLMLGRTLGQPAQPTTFGLQVAGWLAGLDATALELTRMRDEVLAVQLGGAVGTRAGYAGAGAEVAVCVAADLGLVDPMTPWHTERSRIHALGSALGAAVAACGTIATDVILQSQGEIGELAEGSPGGSSAMPHKRNPTASVLVVAAARRSPGLVATLLSSGLHEQQRATGSWHAEWNALRDLLRLAGGAAARIATILNELQVDASAMRRNLDAAGPAVMSEALAALLVPVLGRTSAQESVRRALDDAAEGGGDLVAALRRDPAVAAAVTDDDVEARLNPASWAGDAASLVQRSLDRHARLRRSAR